RLSLIENLRRVAARIAIDRIDRNRAAYWADKISETAEKDPKSLILTIADMARSNPPIVSAFVAELTRRLQGQGAALALPLTWIEQQLSASYLTIGQLVQSENQQQAADQLSISNSIGSLRFLSGMDWRKFVDTMSAVEKTLREDPAGIYDRMDFITRDQYRHSVEAVAKKSKLSEFEVAREAIDLSFQGAAEKNSSGDRETHVGFYLVDKGLPQLKRRVKVRSTAMDMLRKTGRRFPLSLYLGTILIFSGIFSVSLLTDIASDTMDGPLFWFVAVLCLLAVSQLAIALVNLLATSLATPHPMPRMDFSKGIPDKSMALVVVPTLLTSAENIGQLTDALEVRFLANQDKNLRFGLLTDFSDDPEETRAEDEPLVLLARQSIEALNQKYSGAGDNFFLFHRPRIWNPQERIWMGYERKRGKLAELNSLLRGGPGSGFSLIVGNTEVLSKVKYVITLDTDTELPRDAAWQLVGAMAHPLNRPQFDAIKGRIVSGYGILQPQVAVSLPGSNRSRYARMFGSDAGIDPYTRVVSDVYQDIFGEGSFIGKGIYDVDAFEQALKGRFPENLILSHDLIEGCYARSGFISDVLLYEAYPSTYSADVSRRRRWIRGDWQILRWLLPRVPGLNGVSYQNPISALSRWKLFDNLRRSLSPVALILLLLFGWTVLSSPWFSTAAIIGIVLLPSLVTSLMGVLNKPSDAMMRRHIAIATRESGKGVTQALFAFACLPYEAFFSFAAIFHTLWRMLISGKGLLEWNPPESHHTSRSELVQSCRSMCMAPLTALIAAGYLAYARPMALLVALPVLILWFISPFIIWWISTPLRPRKAKLNADQMIFLRKLSRKTWAFFETFVGQADHFLPPDNYQESPTAVVAHRTSPTNIGFALLANLSACDFGYISVQQFMDLTANALQTMEKLERNRGHFYNWYDTESLNPLLPMYISSVDSGNLAACLLTLRAGLLALRDEKLLGRRLFEGLADTVMVLVDVAGKPIPAVLAQFTKDMELMKFSGESAGETSGVDLQSGHSSTLSTPFTVRQRLERLKGSASEVVLHFETDTKSDAAWWARTLAEQCRAAIGEMTLMAPWAGPLPMGKILDAFPYLTEIPTLRQTACLDDNVLPLINERRKLNMTPDDNQKLDNLSNYISSSGQRARERMVLLEDLARRAGDLAQDMDFTFLYDKTRHLLSIGYNVSEGRRDESFYDLLASEARLASFVAIAQGQLPQENWFALGRLLTIAGGEPILLSWSGSMFEYLMPLLVMPTYEQTLLDQTCKAAVARQMDYGKKRGVPWGISESSY
ncbi:MAG: cyclic beta 1-2 glucan synthetase, partial [Desulfosalsimonadaceae bacterium]|nr:cyclic beta 1-2 glucan synthetase [Desulfosalsimonadaceae bacterium]